jgi:ABC-type multidrug transport system ATPase subunit
VDKLVKRYGATTAVDGISFHVDENELFGVIGPDGAGKTTLFRMLVTLLLPDAGSAQVLGRDVVQDLWYLRGHIGYMPGRFSLYPDLSVDENLRFFASVFGTTVEREYEMIAPIFDQLKQFRNRRAADLSGGMKQKLALSCALVHRPRVLFLDEPTTGVDAVSRREFWDLLRHLKETGLTFVVSTPYMDEAERCDRIALMQSGRLLGVDTPRAITAAFDRVLLAVRGTPRYKLLLTLRTFPHAEMVYPFGETLHYTDTRHDGHATTIAGEVADYLHQHGFENATVASAEPTIEDSFIARMGVLIEEKVAS